MSKHFDAIGWDPKSNKSVRAEPPEVSELQDFMAAALSTLKQWTPSVEPTREELDDLVLACNRMWDLDGERLTADVEYSISLQRGKKPYEKGDRAPDPLFKFLRPDVLERPSVAAFVALLDNYEKACGVREKTSSIEHAEISRFLDVVLQSPVGQYMHKYLVKSGKAPKSKKDMKERLREVWFEQYSRCKGETDSSGFEHVFVGESRDGEITGLHNWIQIYLLEQKGQLDYLGYIKPKSRGQPPREPHDAEQLITIQFEWDGLLKPVGSALIGTSPEFEFSLFSVLFFLHKEKTELQLGPYSAKVTVYNYRQRGKTRIGSAYPEASLSKTAAATKIQAQRRGSAARKEEAARLAAQQQQQQQQRPPSVQQTRPPQAVPEPVAKPEPALVKPEPEPVAVPEPVPQFQAVPTPAPVPAVQPAPVPVPVEQAQQLPQQEGGGDSSKAGQTCVGLVFMLLTWLAKRWQAAKQKRQQEKQR
ncbi:unnamed protein product [Chrysoparadoxa australica]